MKINSEKTISALLRISIAVIIVGVLYKIMHWPGADSMLTLGSGIITIVYPIRFFLKKQKLFIDYIKLVLVVSWALDKIISTQHLPYLIFLPYVLYSSLAIWFVLEAKNYFNKSPNYGSNAINYILSNWIFGIAAMLTIIGSMFKIMHWPGASFMLIGGLGTAAVWVLKDIVTKKN